MVAACRVVWRILSVLRWSHAQLRGNSSATLAQLRRPARRFLAQPGGIDGTSASRLVAAHPACLAVAKIVGEATQAGVHEFDRGDICEALTDTPFSCPVCRPLNCPVCRPVCRIVRKRLDMLLAE